MASVEIRPFTSHDLDPVVCLLQQCLTADPMTSGIFQRKVLLDINFDEQGCLVAVADRQIVGFMYGVIRRYQLEDSPPDSDRGWITLFAVAEGWRRQGIASQLLERILAFFRKHRRASIWVSPYAPNYFSPGVDVAAYPEAIVFLEKNGFTTLYRPLSMDASLLKLTTPEWVREKEAKLLSEGVTFDTFRPEHILPLLVFLKNEFPGDWQRYERETMVRIASGESAPDRLWIAMEKGEVVGFCQHEGERFGPFGTAASQRGRGIGAVLMFRCLHRMRAQGLHNAWFLWTGDDVARLYSTAGFVETRRYAVMRKQL